MNPFKLGILSILGVIVLFGVIFGSCRLNHWAEMNSPCTEKILGTSNTECNHRLHKLTIEPGERICRCPPHER